MYAIRSYYVQSIGNKKILLNGELKNLLSDDEIKNLSIKRGTLTTEERDIINSHVSVSIEMLEELPYPKNLKNVPET